MKIFILLLLLIGCKNPIMFSTQSVEKPIVPVDTTVIGNPPDFPEVK